MHAPCSGTESSPISRNKGVSRYIADAQGLCRECNSVSQAGVATRRRVVLQAAAGVCLLRKLSVEKLRRQDADSAIHLWASESLPLSLDDYLTTSWKISDQEWALAAVPLEPLNKARSTLTRRVSHLIIPELCPPVDKRVGIIVWRTPFGLRICIWKNGILIDWHSFSLSTPATLLRNQLKVSSETEQAASEPQWLLFESQANDENTRQLYQSVVECWPAASVAYLSDMSPRQAESAFNKGHVFRDFIEPAKYQPVDAAGKFRLSLALSGLAAAVCFFVFADLQHLEKRVDTLKQEDMLLSVKARRSEQVARRSSDALSQIYDLQSMTVERQGVMAVLKAFQAALPPGTKLLDINLERNGNAAVNALAQNEVDINSFLTRLERSELFDNPTLAFTQQETGSASTDEATALIRFSLELQLVQPLLVLPGMIGDDSDAVTL